MGAASSGWKDHLFIFTCDRVYMCPSKNAAR
jgi:hypothetical protein